MRELGKRALGLVAALVIGGMLATACRDEPREILLEATVVRTVPPGPYCRRSESAGEDPVGVVTLRADGSCGYHGTAGDADGTTVEREGSWNADGDTVRFEWGGEAPWPESEAAFRPATRDAPPALVFAEAGVHVLDEGAAPGEDAAKDAR